jgi:hypothetical protein
MAKTACAGSAIGDDLFPAYIEATLGILSSLFIEGIFCYIAGRHNTGIDRSRNLRTALIEWACGVGSPCYKLHTGQFYMKGK